MLGATSARTGAPRTGAAPPRPRTFTLSRSARSRSTVRRSPPLARALPLALPGYGRVAIGGPVPMAWGASVRLPLSVAAQRWRHLSRFAPSPARPRRAGGTAQEVRRGQGARAKDARVARVPASLSARGQRGEAPPFPRSSVPVCAWRGVALLSGCLRCKAGSATTDIARCCQARAL